MKTKRQTVDFKFAIGDHVKLLEIERPGTVVSLWKEGSGILGEKYQICYWHDGARKTGWVYENEIVLT